MSCERIRELLLDALVGEIGQEERRELDTHLASCPDCVEEVERWDHLWEGLAAAITPEPVEEELERLRARVREEFPSTPRRVGWPIRWAAAALLAVGVGVLLGWGLGRSSTPAPPRGAPEGERYVMIISRVDEPPEESERLASAMGAWFDSLTENGIVESFIGFADEPPVGGTRDRFLLAPDTAGLVIFRAPDAEEARRIAMSSPTLEYGGQIEVRRLDG